MGDIQPSRTRSARVSQQQAPQQQLQQPPPSSPANSGYQDISRRPLTPPIPIQGVGPPLPGTQTGYASGGSVAPDDDDDDTVYPSTAPAWTAGGYASALGLAGDADQGYARGGPVEPAGSNFRRILTHNRRRFGLHQQPSGYAEGGIVEDYDNGDYIEPEQPAPDPNSAIDAATPADDAAPVTSTLQDPDVNERLAQRVRRPSAKQPPATDEPPSADTNIVKLLGQAAQRGAEDVGSAVGRGVSAAGRGVADTASGIGSAVADKYGSMKDRLAAYVRGDGGQPPEQVQQLIRAKEAANPGASHNDNLQSVFDDFISQYRHDDAGNFVQSLRQPYDQARAVSQAALAQGNIDASVKAFEHAHNLLPNDTNLKLDRNPDGTIRATVAERGGDAYTKVLTPQQYADWIKSPGTQLDHMGDLGTGKSLEVAGRSPAGPYAATGNVPGAAPTRAPYDVDNPPGAPEGSRTVQIPDGRKLTLAPNGAVAGMTDAQGAPLSLAQPGMREPSMRTPETMQDYLAATGPESAATTARRYSRIAAPGIVQTPDGRKIPIEQNARELQALQTADRAANRPPPSTFVADPKLKGALQVEEERSRREAARQGTIGARQQAGLDFKHENLTWLQSKHTQDLAQRYLTNAEQETMKTMRSRLNQGMSPEPEDLAVYKKLATLATNAGVYVPPLGEQPAQAPAAAPATQTQTPRAQPPAAAIQALRSNPSLRGQFDAYYGQGASAQALSGP